MSSFRLYYLRVEKGEEGVLSIDSIGMNNNKNNMEVVDWVKILDTLRSSGDFQNLHTAFTGFEN